MTYYIINDNQELMLKLPDLKQGMEWRIKHVGGDTFEVQIAEGARLSISGFGAWMPTQGRWMPTPDRVRPDYNAIQAITDSIKAETAKINYALGLTATKAGTCEACEGWSAWMPKDPPLYAVARATLDTGKEICPVCGDETSHVPNGLMCRGSSK